MKARRIRRVAKASAKKAGEGATLETENNQRKASAKSNIKRGENHRISV